MANKKKAAKKRSAKTQRLNWRIGIFSPVTTREKAVVMIRQGSLVFYMVAVIMVAWSEFRYLPLIAGGVGYAVLGLWLQKFQSRIAAFLLIALSMFYLFLNEAVRRGWATHGATNIFFAFIVLIIAARVFEAALKLHSKWKDQARID